MINAFRIVRTVHAEDAFNGEGARLQGGRWNAPGHAVVYTAESIALATLELLVNLTDSKNVKQYSVIECLFPEGVFEHVDRSLLPDDWFTYPPPAMLQQIGNQWLIERASAVLAVPSAIIPTELNYLLNPEHPDFRSVEIGVPRPFRLDLRLLT